MYYFTYNMYRDFMYYIIYVLLISDIYFYCIIISKRKVPPDRKLKKDWI